MTSAAVVRCLNEALPGEVFGIIFEEHAKLEWKAPLIDGQVCRQWRRTILCSPRAWSHLRISHKFKSAPSKLYQWLDRSGSAPLYIQAINWTWGIEKVLDQHFKRIQSITLLRQHVSLLDYHWFPILQSLTIYSLNTSIVTVRWSTSCAMPALRFLRARYISMSALRSNVFPPLRDLALFKVYDCESIIRNSYHSLTSLMLGYTLLQDTSESLEFPSLRFLSFNRVHNIKHRMNVPALTTYHESEEMEEESFPMSLPSLIEYGVYRPNDNSPINVTKLHQCYPNISRLSTRDRPSNVRQFIHSLSSQPTALPMLQILAVEDVYRSTRYSGEDKESMRNDVSVRNMASSVKMELCFDGRARLPLYFGDVSVYINKYQSKLTSILRIRILAIEDISFILGLWLPC